MEEFELVGSGGCLGFVGVLLLRSVLFLCSLHGSGSGRESLRSGDLGLCRELALDYRI